MTPPRDPIFPASPAEWYVHHAVQLSHPACRSISLAYRSAGSGRPVLLLHEFGCGSWSWEKLVPLLSSDFTVITPDLAGCGSSDAETDIPLTTVTQTELTALFIEQLDLRDIILVGHGMGGEIALGLLMRPEIRSRVGALALVSCGAMEKDIPSNIANLGHSSMTRPILNLIYSGFVIRMILKYAYAPHHTPDPALCAHYAADLNRPRHIEALIAAAQAYARPAALPVLDDLPISIIAGDEDRILSYEAAERLHRKYPGSRLSFLSGCGHIPQEECPKETAAILRAFIAGQPENPVSAGPDVKPHKLKLSRLFDFWHPGTLVLIIILKILSFFRSLGIRVERQSWRKISRFFLKREYSKFIIAQFRLRNGQHTDIPQARAFLERNLHDFLLGQPGLYAQGNSPDQFCDLMVAEISGAGEILSISPHFDPRFPPPPKFVAEILSVIISVHNENRHYNDFSRPKHLRSECRRRLRGLTRFRPRQSDRIRRLFDRIMEATFLFYDQTLPSDETKLDNTRFKTPDLNVFRHPGWGQTNIICRLTSDGAEADLWWQFNHTMADGAPMQDILSGLKKNWGTAGSLIFPALNGQVSEPEITVCANGSFRARFFADFTPLLRLRTSLNRMCSQQMNGKASFAALILWGIARHPAFHGRKILLPVDCRNADGSRRLGLLVTRPDRFDNGISPLQDFCRFQAYMNRHLEDVRNGQAETSEMLSLFSMLHPVFYQLTQKLYPLALEEMLGTVGISIIADAEVFVSPQTDIQINGFMALGSALIQTRDNRRAGSVCISGTREQIAVFHEAVAQFIDSLPHLLER